MTRRMTGPLSVEGAEAYVASTCFKTGPPGKVGVELELLVFDAADPTRTVDAVRSRSAFAGLVPLPAASSLTTEPGGQVELSSRPAASLSDCVAAVSADLAHLRKAAESAGLHLVGCGTDPYRTPQRVIDIPRYVAMEEFFDRFGPEGRVMMCATASVQICLDAGSDDGGVAGYRHRWRLVHALGPVFVAAFANSPLYANRPTGWRSTRQAVWSRLDPSRTSAASVDPAVDTDVDPALAWARYALDAKVLCVRSDRERWTVPAGFTFREWLAGAGPRPADQSDLEYHLTTLFPPVRPHGWLELRMIDAQPDGGWVVPTAVVTALVEDEAAARAALAAVEPLWRADQLDPWRLAAREGLSHPVLQAAAAECFGAALAALDRMGAPTSVSAVVRQFVETYVDRGRCPADDRLDEWRAAVAR